MFVVKLNSPASCPPELTFELFLKFILKCHLIWGHRCPFLVQVLQQTDFRFLEGGFTCKVLKKTVKYWAKKTDSELL